LRPGNRAVLPAQRAPLVERAVRGARAACAHEPADHSERGDGVHKHHLDIRSADPGFAVMLPRRATRTERDPLGALEVPANALYGVQTLRAVMNFPISGLMPLPSFVDAVVRIKRAAALTHKDTGRLEASIADAIVEARDEILGGAHRDQFVVDVYQAGAGTSHNMNVNEVLANRANELLGATRGAYAPVHPND